MTIARGRPRSAAADIALADAVFALLADVGYPGLSIEQVAASAGVGKATVYRRWGSKAEMVFGVVVHGDVIHPPEDQGSLPADLAALTEHVIALLAAPAARQALPGLLADLAGDPALRTRFHDTVVAAQREVVGEVVARAVERGELAAPPDVADVHAQLLGTVFAWLHLLGEPLPADLGERITTALLATLRDRDRH